MMTMEKLKRRFNTSPMIKKKGTLNGFSSAGTVRGDGSSGVVHQKTFGASLEELALRERSDVPLIIRKICEYVLERGLTLEGLFRINGNVRLIQNMMSAYEAEGDIDLSECNDVHSVAGLLKRFVRDLSDGLIPERLTADFIKAIEVNGDSDDDCISEIRKLLNSLSHESYSTLRYLCFFLWEISQKEDENKMSAGSLGIVFGPNVFRCGENWISLGLSLSYTHCNRAMSIMISHCHEIFDKLEAGCILPKKPTTSTQKATPPPRPPPPILASPGESPRLLLQATWGRTQSEDTGLMPRASSPFLQDNSETECSLSRDFISGPPAPGVSHVIHYVVSDSIFGENETETKSTPSPKPRKRRAKNPATNETKPSEDSETSDTITRRRTGPTSETTETSGPDSAPSVAPRRRRSGGNLINGEVNNNLPASHSLPDLMINVTDTHTSDGDQSIAEVTTRLTGESDEDRSLLLVQDLRRQIQGLKRSVRRFEDEFVKANGHKPSVTEKNSNKVVRTCLSDLAACRHRLRALQDGSDDSEPVLKLSARSRSVEHMHVNGGSREILSPRPKNRLKHKADTFDVEAKSSKSSLEIALEELEHELQVKRELSGRPENLLSMTLDQMREEKTTLQRALLNHESRYGRPQTLQEKEVMRPVYDRYRSVKRFLVDVKQGEPADSMVQSAVVGVSSTDEGPSASGDLFAVTQDFQARMRREGLMTSSVVHSPVAAPVVRRRMNPRSAESRIKHLSQPVMASSMHLGESLDNLREEERQLLSEKKELQRQLKQYERQFEQETGRRLGREDRLPMQEEYLRYKNIKIKLKDLQRHFI